MLSKRKILEGTVIKAKMKRTVIAEVERKERHPMYGKIVIRKNKYMVHDSTGSLNVGDKIEMIECRPLSKNKRWSVFKVIDRVNQED